MVSEIKINNIEIEIPTIVTHTSHYGLHEEKFQVFSDSKIYSNEGNKPANISNSIGIILKIENQ